MEIAPAYWWAIGGSFRPQLDPAKAVDFPPPCIERSSRFQVHWPHQT